MRGFRPIAPRPANFTTVSEPVQSPNDKIPQPASRGYHNLDDPKLPSTTSSVSPASVWPTYGDLPTNAQSLSDDMSPTNNSVRASGDGHQGPVLTHFRTALQAKGFSQAQIQEATQDVEGFRDFLQKHWTDFDPLDSQNSCEGQTASQLHGDRGGRQNTSVAETAFRVKTANKLWSLGYFQADIDEVNKNISLESCFENLINGPPPPLSGNGGSRFPSVPVQDTEMSDYDHNTTARHAHSGMFQDDGADQDASTESADHNGLPSPPDSSDDAMYEDESE